MAKKLLDALGLGSHDDGDGDITPDDAVASSRDTGGVENPDDPNQASTTSTTPDGTYVGRIAGDDVGYAGETGAEARAEADRGSGPAAAGEPGVETGHKPAEPGVCC